MSLDTAKAETHFNHVGTPHSELVDHGECCQLAKKWLSSTHRSLSFHRSESQSFHAPKWLRQRYSWGPVQWPLSWCEAVKRSHIDCGVFAAFAREVFKSSGMKAFPAQILLSQPDTYIHQWNVKWASVFQNIKWIGVQNVYHEVCAVVTDGDSQVKIYDPTEGVWLESEFTHGINGVVGLNIMSPTILNWGTIKVGQGKWVLK